MRILVVNAGSSSLKLRVLDGDEVVDDASIEARAGEFDLGALQVVLGRHPDGIDAVGHRVVHGGAGLTAPVRIDDRVLSAIAALTPLAPLHQPAALAAIRAADELLPAVPAVACFDTAFHPGFRSCLSGSGAKFQVGLGR